MAEALEASVLEYPSEGEDGADFLRRRVAMAGIVMGDAFLVFLVFRTVELLVAGLFKQLIDPSFLLHALTSLIFFSMWLVLRIETLSVPAIRTVEAVGVILGSVTTILMGTFIPLQARPDFIILAAMILMFFARSVWVPSSARRTAILGVAIGIPMVITMYVRFLGFDVAAYEAVLEEFANVDIDVTPHSIATNVATSLAVWWALAIGTAASASKVFYGLRQQVRDAKQLGQYKLERKLGEGGMGMVFCATHGMLRRPTAVKLLLPEKAGEHNLVRFEREVQLTATLTHPNTVTIFDYGRTPDGVFYYAMELLNGATLEAIVDLKLPMPEARIHKILEQIAGALAEAHDRGLIHRDIKPSNIMLCHYGGKHDMVKVLDFGLVKEIGAGERGEGQLTQTEALTGTPQYMSPEAISNPDHVDAHSDVYSFGCVAYYLLTGRHVFEAKSVVEICGHHLHSQPRAPSAVTGRPINPGLEQLVLQCLAKNPTDRPANGRALFDALERIPVESSWRENDAAEWWEEYGAALQTGREGESVDSDLRTIDIDMERRRAATPRGSQHEALL